MHASNHEKRGLITVSKPTLNFSHVSYNYIMTFQDEGRKRQKLTVDI